MRLNPGDKAVPFSAETIEGKTVSLESFAGKPLLLMFYRYASCPMCNLRLRDFAQHYPRLHERGLEVVAFFHSQECRQAELSFSSRSRSGIQRVPQLRYRDVVAAVFAVHAAAGLLYRLGPLDALRLLGRRRLANGQNACRFSHWARRSHSENPLRARDRRSFVSQGSGGHTKRPQYHCKRMTDVLLCTRGKEITVKYERSRGINP